MSANSETGKGEPAYGPEDGDINNINPQPLTPTGAALTTLTLTSHTHGSREGSMRLMPPIHLGRTLCASCFPYTRRYTTQGGITRRYTTQGGIPGYIQSREAYPGIYSPERHTQGGIYTRVHTQGGIYHPGIHHRTGMVGRYTPPYVMVGRYIHG